MDAIEKLTFCFPLLASECLLVIRGDSVTREVRNTRATAAPLIHNSAKWCLALTMQLRYRIQRYSVSDLQAAA